MKCGEVYNSVLTGAWQKLSGVSMKPKLAFKVLKYTKEVSNEYAAIETQRTALIHDITGASPGAEAKIEPDTEEFKRFIGGFQEILLVNSDLKKLDILFSDVVDAVDEKDESLTIADLSSLEPFFACTDDCDCDETVPDDATEV